MVTSEWNALASQLLTPKRWIGLVKAQEGEEQRADCEKEATVYVRVHCFGSRAILGEYFHKDFVQLKYFPCQTNKAKLKVALQGIIPGDKAEK